MLMKSPIAVLGLVILSLTGAVLADQNELRKEKHPPVGKAVLWQEPRDIGSRDLYLGPGGEALKPNLSKVTVVEEKESAHSVKLRVRDGADREWVIKSGGETQLEVAASRIAWAAGYYTEISYLVPRVEIQGRGVFENVRFEARSKSVKRLDQWLWDDNPFIGTDPLQGLKVLLALLDNWDLRDENNRILFARRDEASGDHLLYITGDFDAPSDKTGGAPSLWRATGHQPQAANTRFIDKVKDNLIEFNYTGRHKERLANITVAQARWMGSILSRLSEQQISDALRAGNFGPDQVAVMAQIIRARISELVNLPKP